MEPASRAMSMWIPCPICGEAMEVPAYEGDGVYHAHYCPTPEPEQQGAE